MLAEDARQWGNKHHKLITTLEEVENKRSVEVIKNTENLD